MKVCTNMIAEILHQTKVSDPISDLLLSTSFTVILRKNYKVSHSEKRCNGKLNTLFYSSEGSKILKDKKTMDMRFYTNRAQL